MGVTAAATSFDQATAATPAGQGRYQVLPDARFAVGAPEPAVNGGVLLASMLRGVLAESAHPYPVATSAHFLRVPRIAPAQVEVSWLKQGRTAAVARAVLTQDGVPLIDATVTTGALPGPPAPGTGTSDFPERLRTGQSGSASQPDGAGAPAAAAAAAASDGHAGPGTATAGLAAEEGPAWTAEGLSWSAEPPAFPPADECIELRQLRGLHDQVEIRLDPATAGWLHGQPGGTPEMRGYFRLREDREPDAYLLAFAVDAMPPVVFGLGALGWAPTVELTWYMRAVPAPGLLRVAARSRLVSGGWFDEESEVWDSAGRLVAQSRQLARVGRPPAGGAGAPVAARCR
jgi:hypothetical protein